MHEQYMADLAKSMKKRAYITASWLCYSMFEQRTNRIIEKYIDQCPRRTRTSKAPTGAISNRLKCIKKICESSYDGFTEIDVTLLSQIIEWCKDRNSLMHDLVRIDRYKKYDDDFKLLAEQGYGLIMRYYEAATKFRNWYQTDENKMPAIRHWTCPSNWEKCINCSGMH